MLKLNLKRLLIDDAKRWYKLASAQLAIAGGVIVAGVVADPTIVGQVVAVLPAALVPFAPPVVGVIAAAVPIVVRLWRQTPPSTPAPATD
ncbi:hypothetical protein EWE75_12020 [Sphingomonas populi]|uniref:Holin n=1 Tax=Sphingomonas populi TaxID=2484750 RepID=A0A4Q6XW46_9SPHN|nr:hypothetical protein [Sphingomonas populi]RZF64265.1 hypothetical protein EWE75_12020 [Sphingomonas populi]